MGFAGGFLGEQKDGRLFGGGFCFLILVSGGSGAYPQLRSCPRPVGRAVLEMELNFLSAALPSFREQSICHHLPPRATSCSFNASPLISGVSATSRNSGLGFSLQ